MPTFTMVDLETMGNGTDAAICSIGAVKFDPDVDSSTDTEFYAHVNLQSAQDFGGKIEAATVLWWMAQSAQATAAITRQDDAVHIHDALLRFATFYQGSDGIWAAPSTFDIPILQSAFKRMGITDAPWNFRQVRTAQVRAAQIHCWSTVRKLLKIPKAPNADEHHALADARAQVVAFRQGWHMLKKANHLLSP